MIVQCAACQTRFKIADEKVTERGVKVKCTKCATTFVVRKDAPVAAPEVTPVGRDPRLAAPSPAPSARAATGPAAKAAPKAQPALARPNPFAAFEGGAAAPAPADPFAAFSSPAAAPAPEATSPGLYLDGLRKMTAPESVEDDIPPPTEKTVVRAIPKQFLEASRTGVPPPSSLSPSAADPFAAPAPRPPPAADPFAALSDAASASDPFAAAAPPATSSADPFAALQTDDPFAAPPPSRPVADPFANASLDLEPTARPAAPAPKDPFANVGVDLGAALDTAPSSTSADPFAGAGLDLGAMLGAPPADLGAPAAAHVDPFASEPPPPPAQPKVEAAPRPSPKPAPPAPVPASAAQALKADAPPAPPEPRPAPLPAARPQVRTPPRRRSALSSVLNALFFALTGVAILVLAVVVQSDGRVELKTLNAQVLMDLIRGRSTGELQPVRVINGLFETQTGRPVFYVRGHIRNAGATAAGPVKVTVEVRNGSDVVRSSSALVGAVPTPEDVFGVSSPAALTALQTRLRHQASTLAPGDEGEFVVIFYEYPDDLAEDGLRVRAEITAPELTRPAEPPHTKAPEKNEAPAQQAAAAPEAPAAPVPAAPPSEAPAPAAH